MVMVVKAHSFEGHPDDWADDTWEQYKREEHIREKYRIRERQRELGVVADGIWGVQTRAAAESARKSIVPTESAHVGGKVNASFSFPSTATIMQIIGWGGTVVSLIVWAWP